MVRFRSSGGPVTLGLEEEIMALDPVTLDLLACGPELVDGLDSRFKTELPASHVEIATKPAGSIDDLAIQLLDCRRMLAGHIGDRACLAAAGVHPFASRSGVLNKGERYDRLLADYGEVLRQQLVCGLHVHVGISGTGKMLAVYNAMRSYLPEVAALAANAPIHAGQDTAMASVRPRISGMLPRQGIPPPFRSWEHYAAQINWGIQTGHWSKPGEWWWELRLHAGLGTLEIRVPDTQTTVADAAAVCALAAGIAGWLAERYDADDLPPPDPSWRINENRCSAARYGLTGMLVDLQTGHAQPAQERILRLIDEISPIVEALGGADHLGHAKELAEQNGSQRQRDVFVAQGCRGVVAWLTERFLNP